jgi:hypothetical protein
MPSFQFNLLSPERLFAGYVDRGTSPGIEGDFACSPVRQLSWLWCDHATSRSWPERRSRGEASAFGAGANELS